MTTPNLIDEIVPLKYKWLVGLAGSALSFGIPYVTAVQNYLPSPWPAVIGFVLAALTGVGVQQAPYAPAGTALAPAPTVPAPVPATPTVQVARVDATGTYRNPWKP